MCYPGLTSLSIKLQGRSSRFIPVGSLFFAITVLFMGPLARARADAIDKIIEAQMKEHHIPGLAFTILKNGEITRKGAFGVANLELETPVSTRSLFEIGSVTKEFTAAGILLLAEQGKLDIDAKIASFFPKSPASWSRITLRHLLTHTSGLTNYNDLPGFEVARKLTAETFIAALGRHALLSAPGEKFFYSNSNFNLLGYVIEKVSGEDYWSFMARRVYQPLKMASTQQRDPRQIVRGRTTGYEVHEGKPAKRDECDLTDIFSAGAMLSNVEDLSKWVGALEKGKFLSAKSREKMWTPVKLNDGSTYPYGFGWRLQDHNGETSIWHTGSTSGFAAALQRFPKRNLAVIVLCNSGESGVANKVALDIADSLLK
jgi:CubicO group peptidase (beta-lactamase class C family)